MRDTLPGGVPPLARLCDFVRYYAARAPNREALIFGEERLDYAEFNRRVDQCAAALHLSGVRAGDRVAMFTTPRPEFAIVLMATQRLGAIWVGLNTRYRLPELQHILKDCQPKLLITLLETPEGRRLEADLRALRDASAVAEIITFPGSMEGFGPYLDQVMMAADPQAEHEIVADLNAPTVIVYTSGTTGRPKGALLAHRNLTYCYQSVSRSFEGKEYLRDGLRILCNLPPNHIGCISEMLGNAIIRGGTVVFADHFDPGAMLAMIPKEGITLIGGVPVMLEAVFGDPSFAAADLSGLKAIGWGGAPATRDLVERMAATGAHLFTNYGLTEGGAVVSATPSSYSLGELCETVGRPDTSSDHKIMTDDESEAAVGDAGEIWLRGPGVFLGYWNNREATDAAMTPDGWLRTGDLAAMREDGAWRLQGRRMEMFKSGGFNVYPREIELALEEHPSVGYVAVISKPDPQYFEVGVAFVVPKHSHAVSAAELNIFLRDRLANYKVPKSIHIRDSLPMLPIGKVDKAALREVG